MKKITENNYEKFIYNERMSGKTLQSISDNLNKQFIPYVNKFGKSNKWTAQTVDMALRKYMGENEFKVWQKENKNGRDKKCKEIWTLYTKESKSFDEISEIMNMKIYSVYSYFAQYRKKNNLPNKKKQLQEKIANLIIELRDVKGISFFDIAIKLNQMGYVTFNKRKPWDEGTALSLYTTFKNKI